MDDSNSPQQNYNKRKNTKQNKGNYDQVMEKNERFGSFGKNISNGSKAKTDEDLVKKGLRSH